MAKASQMIIEKDQPFSTSLFWQGQRQFYHEKGIEAWASEVPFYITSNPFIAHRYAEIVLRFIQDWIKQHPGAEKDPFYIVELGAGSGQFSFYMLKSLTELLQNFSLQDIRLNYIMTDFTENNIRFWQQHQQLIPYVESQLLDFARFDLEKDQTIVTTERKTTLTTGSCKNPMVVVANYLFDSVISDIFSVKNKKIQQSLVSLSTTSNNVTKGQVKNWQRVSIKHQEKPIDAQHYLDPTLNTIVHEYASTLGDGYLLFPIGCLQGLNNLKKLCHDQMLLISSDKGHSTLGELKDRDFPQLDFHGSFSLMVNYHAVTRYFQLKNGDAFLQSPRDGLTTAVFSSGFKLDEMHETRYLLTESVEGFSPSDFFNYYELVESGAKFMRLNALASTLCVSRWDPFVFEIIAERLAELFPKGSTEVIEYICNNLRKIADNFYYVPGCDDVFFSIGYLLYSIDRFDLAVEYYCQSKQMFPANFELLYNLALCYFYQKKYKKSMATLNEALVLDPKNKDVKTLLRAIKAKIK